MKNIKNSTTFNYLFAILIKTVSTIVAVLFCFLFSYSKHEAKLYMYLRFNLQASQHQHFSCQIKYHEMIAYIIACDTDMALANEFENTPHKSIDHKYNMKSQPIPIIPFII